MTKRATRPIAVSAWWEGSMIRGLREVTFTMRIHDRRSDRIIVESVSFTALEIDRQGGDVGALLSLVGHGVRSLRRVLRHHWRLTVLGLNYPARLRAARLKRHAMAGWDKHRAPLLEPWEVERERARFAAELEVRWPTPSRMERSQWQESSTT